MFGRLPIWARAYTTAAAPVLISSSVDLADTAGGDSVVLTGTDLTGSTVEVSTGPGWQSIAPTANTSTSVTFAFPARAAGNWQVRVTTAGGTSNELSIEAWNESVEAWTGLWPAPYTGSPWPGLASAGSSSGRNLAEATNPPAVGAPANGRTPADFDGVNDQLQYSDTTHLISSASGSAAVLFYADTAQADAGATLPYNNPCLLSESRSRWSIGYSTSGVRFGTFDNATGLQNSVAVPASTGAWHLAQVRWNSTTIEVRVDTGAWVALAHALTLTTPTTFRMGANFNATKFFGGRILAAVTANDRKADAIFEKLRKLWTLRYGVTLPVVPAPSLTSQSLDLVDTAGGNPVTLGGTNLDSATVQVGVDTAGSSWTNVTPSANTSSSVTFTMPARAAGTYPVRVVAAGGTSGSLSIESFDPKVIASLKMWLDPSDAANRTLNGSNEITQLADKSGNGNHAVGTVPAPRGAAAINGRDTINFNGSQYFTLANLSALTAAEVFAVLKATTADGGGTARGLWLLGANIAANYYPFTDSKVYDNFGSSTRRSFTPAGTITNAHVYNVISTSTEWTANHDGVQSFTAGTNTVSFHTFDWLGRSSNTSSYFAGHMGDIVLFGAKLSSTDRTKMNKWLRLRWGTP